MTWQYTLVTLSPALETWQIDLTNWSDAWVNLEWFCLGPSRLKFAVRWPSTCFWPFWSNLKQWSKTYFPDFLSQAKPLGTKNVFVFSLPPQTLVHRENNDKKCICYFFVYYVQKLFYNSTLAIVSHSVQFELKQLQQQECTYVWW